MHRNTDTNETELQALDDGQCCVQKIVVPNDLSIKLIKMSAHTSIAINFQQRESESEKDVLLHTQRKKNIYALLIQLLFCE